MLSRKVWKGLFGYFPRKPTLKLLLSFRHSDFRTEKKGMHYVLLRSTRFLITFVFFFFYFVPY